MGKAGGGLCPEQGLILRKIAQVLVSELVIIQTIITFFSRITVARGMRDTTK